MDHRSTDMTSEVSKQDEKGALSPFGQEIEFALILQKMINVVKEDPAQMRLAIYEFARARLKIDAGEVDGAERARMAEALETAINGVERFSIHENDILRLPHAPESQSGKLPTEAAVIRPIDPPMQDILIPERVSIYRDAPRPSMREVHRPSTSGWLARAAISLLVVVGGVVLVTYRHQFVGFGDRLALFHAPVRPIVEPSPVPVANSAPAAPSVIPNTPPASAAPAPPQPPFPVPTDYGVYALVGDDLVELQQLAERIPDKRIAISTPVTEASRTTLADGRARFIIYRRDMADHAPDRMDVRVLGKVVRAISFDAKGKPVFSAVQDAWNIRNIAYEYRVRPVPGKPEMLLVQREKPDSALPAGRYTLVLNDRGYDFTVAGTVTDPAQCLERTDAANGAFYSSCQKP
jgi:hypothetical protein